MSSYNPNIDLTGKLIIKVRLGDDIRRIPIHNDDLTYDELMLMMQRIYSDKLSSKDDITLKYKDEDGDLITLFDSSDLTFATQCSRILKLTLFVNGQPRPLENNEKKYVKKELRNMRDRVNHLLDRLEPQWNDGCTDHLSIIKDGSKVSESPSKMVMQSSPSPGISLAQGKEFDPLSSQRSVEENTQNKVMSSFGLSNDAVADRSGTPDSLSSAGSSTGNQYRVPQASQQPQPQHPQAFSSPNAHPRPSQTQVMSQQAAFQGPQPQPQSQLEQQPQSQLQQQPQSQLQATTQPQSQQQMPFTGQQLAQQQQLQQQQQQQQQQQPAGFQSYSQPQRFPSPAATGQPVTSQPGAPQPGQPHAGPAQHQVQPQMGGASAGFSPQYGMPTPQQPQAQPQMFQQTPAQSQSYSGYAQPGASSGGASISPAQQSGNPYARGSGSGYAGYPRPAGNYPQAGYQQQ